MKKLLLIGIILLLSISIAHGANFEVTDSPIYDKISLLEDAKIEITVTNNEMISNTFRFSVNNPNWNLFAEDTAVKNTGLKISGNSSKTVTLIFKPTLDAPGGRNTITLNVENEKTKETVKHEFPIIVRKEGYDGYIAAINTKIEFQDKIDPREPLFLKLKLENQNRRDNPLIEVKLNSNTFNKEFNTSLGPLANKTEEIMIELNPLTYPTKDKLKTLLIIDGTRFTPESIDFEIIDYTSEFTKTENPSEYLFKKTNTITIKNDGNKESTQTVKILVPWYKSIFTSSNPKITSIIKENDERFLGFDLTLNPKESTEIIVITNYRWLMIILVAIVLFILYLWFIRSPLELEKRAEKLNKKIDGISELKVSLYLKNRSGKALEGIEIRDIVPNIAEVKKEFEIGTLAPNKTFKNKSGNTVMKWNIQDLDPHEERIICYKIKSKLSIVGDFELPVAIVKYRNRKGAELIVKSNKTTISSNKSPEEQ